MYYKYDGNSDYNNANSMFKTNLDYTRNSLDLNTFLDQRAVLCGSTIDTQAATGLDGAFKVKWCESHYTVYL